MKLILNNLNKTIEKQINEENNILLENKEVKLKECISIIELQKKSLEILQKEYINTIKELGFENENQYNEQILKEADIKKIKQEIEQYKEKVTTIKTRLEDIKKEIKEKDIIDVTPDIKNLERLSQNQKEKEQKINDKKAAINFNKDTNKKLKRNRHRIRR